MTDRYSHYPHQPSQNLTQRVAETSQQQKANWEQRIQENAAVDYQALTKDWLHLYHQHKQQHQHQQHEIDKQRHKLWTTEL